MDKTLASEFAAKSREYSEWFNAMTELSARIPDVQLARKIRGALAGGFLELDLVLFNPLRHEHPDLFDPEWFES